MSVIEITYNNGEKYTACFADESYENVIACLLDDISILHNMGMAEEEQK